MARTAIAALQVALVLVFLLLVLAQAVVLPGLAEDSARRFPEAASLKTPVLVLAISTIACTQVAVVCAGKLLTMVSQQRLFEPAAFRYADVLVGATAAATSLVMAVGAYVSFTTGSPVWVLCAAVAAVGAGTTLLMNVVRTRQRQARQRHAELAEVA